MPRTLLLSVIVTAHAEGRLLHPTLRSIWSALQSVVEAGGDCELVLVADNATPETLHHARTWAHEDSDAIAFTLIETATGDPGQARNAGVSRSRGRFVALQDGDDLVSRTYFSDGVALLTASAAETIVHPETLITFGARSSRSRARSTTDPTVSYRDLMAVNLWPSSSISARETYEAHPYPHLPPGNGFGPEDWMWNIQTTIAGYSHLVVPESVYFYRTRESQGVSSRNQTALLPRFDLAGLRLRLPDHSESRASAANPNPRRRPSRIMKAGRWVVRRFPARLALSARLMFQAARVAVDRSIVIPDHAARRAALGLRTRVELAAAFRDAAAIEPALTNTLANYERLEVWTAEDEGFGRVLDELLLALGDARAWVMVPWLGIGGADLVALNYAKGLARSERFGGSTAIIATYLPSRTIRELVPPDVTFVQVSTDLRALTPARQNQLIAQAIALTQPGLVVGVNCFDLVEALGSFSNPMTASSPIYLSLFAFDRIGDGYPTNPITDDPARYFLDSIAGLITDNTATKGYVDETLGLDPGFMRVHRQPALDEIPALDERTSAFQDERFDSEHRFRLLWPHRLDPEKRPRSLIRVMELARSRGLPISIDVYGSRVLGESGDKILADLERAGIAYRGPYSGGLAALPTSEYHAMLLTSAWEGLPLVVVQSMLLGIPVIATAVGGVPDIVLDRQTGFLAKDPDDAVAFVDAIETLIASREERRRVIRAAYAFAVDNHGWDRFRERIDDLAPASYGSTQGN